MILESWPWKQDLLRRKSLLIRYNTSDHLLENEERAYTTIEKAIFILLLLSESLLTVGEN